jgi:predicted metal-dependent phosphotriesterase family hydrolase
VNIVRTVLGDIDPATLGLTLPHEHLMAHPPAEVTDPDLRLDDEVAAVSELRSFRQAGGKAVVDMTTVDYGRDVRALARIAATSGTHLIAATGYNKGKFSDRLTQSLSVEAIASWMTSEVGLGIDGTGIRAGVIKAATGLHGPGEGERKMLEAAAIAHRRTQAPISTHTEQGTWALEQVQFLTDRGVPPERLLIGHLDLHPDLAYLRQVAATGVYLGLDQFCKEKYLSDQERVRLALALAAEGFGHRLLLSGDMARRSYWQTYGGPGFRHIPTTVRSLLISAGASEDLVEMLLVENGRNFLAFEPAG